MEAELRLGPTLRTGGGHLLDHRQRIRQEGYRQDPTLLMMPLVRGDDVVDCQSDRLQYGLEVDATITALHLTLFSR